MLRTITQKCPSCGYVHVEQQHIEVPVVSVDKRYTRRPVRSLNPISRKGIVKRDYLEGDKEFTQIALSDYLECYNPQYHPEMTLLVCPKCGTVLAPWVTTKTEETEE